ncbi:oligosaccharide flippase family protein [Alcaligenes sp. PF14]|uniref:oligosaccharide flippase family protein n=1 Tax=Alcaligenes sp. PF14 TaxID=3120297 RepID=UPI00301758FB
MPISIFKKLLTNSFWSVLASTSNRGVALILSILAARLLTESDFSSFSIIQNTLTTLYTLASLGVSVAGAKFISESLNISFYNIIKIQNILLKVTYISASGFIVFLLILKNEIAQYIFHSLDSGVYVYFLSALLFINVLIGTQTGILSGLKEFKSQAKVQFFIGFLNLLLQAISIYFFGFFELLFAWVFGNSLVLLANHYVIRSSISKHKLIKSLYPPAPPPIDKKLIIRFMLATAGTSIIVIPAHTIVLAWLNNGINHIEIGWFQTGVLWMQLVAFVPTSIANVFITSLSPLLAEKKFVEVKETAFKSIKAVVGLSLLISFLAAFLSPFIISVYGSKFNGFSSIFYISLACGFVLSINTILGSVMLSAGLASKALITNFVWSLFYISLSFIFLQEGFGVFYVFLSCLIAYLIHFLLIIFYIYSHFSKIKII